MKVFGKKSQQERLLETVDDSLDALGGLPKGRILTAGLVAGGLAAVTAVSAGISSLRRREEERQAIRSQGRA